jgi:DNA-binding NtrC family response regulator
VTTPFHITIVDDNVDLLVLYTGLLSRCFPNVCVTCFEDPLLMLEQFGTSKMDLLIVDHGLGSMTGVDLIRKLSERDLHIPVVAISGDPRTSQDFMAAGATEFLEKTMTVTRLATTVGRLLPH